MTLEAAFPHPLLTSPVAAAMTKVMEHIPDTYFFLKDRQSRFVHANRALLDRLGLHSAADIIGTSDLDRYPPHVAEQLVAGDQRVMKSGVPLIEHADVLFDHSGRLEWFSTSKYPIFDEQETPLGVVGITRSFSGRNARDSANHAAGKTIDFVCANPAAVLRVSELAHRFGISERQLHRQFLDFVKMSPRDFILRTRIQAAAADLRQTSEAVASIALKYRFCDQSAFTRQFRKLLGITPASYRKRRSESFAVS